MFHKLKEYIVSLITTRIIFLLLIFTILPCILIYRIFDLQIINGANYLNNFQLMSKKTRTLDAARGNIYDCNGVLLAYNELAYSVNIEDVYESGSDKNEKLNKTILFAINAIEENKDTVINEFDIKLDENDNYYFTLEGVRLQRFKADIYGRRLIDEMTYSEASATADDIMAYLVGDKRYNISELNVDKQTSLKITAIRYAMSANAYQKYITTTIAKNVSEKTVAKIMENSDILDGVSISEDTIRKYPTAQYTSQIIGYTGKISSTEFDTLSLEDPTYTQNDTVGKIGIEKSQESILRGTKGSETVYVDTMGKVISIASYNESKAGNNLYLTIDSKLQEACYHIIEQKLAGILLKKIVNTKEYIPGENASASKIVIPIYDVYYALFNNNVIDTSHFSQKDASESEKTVYEAFETKKAEVLEKLSSQLRNEATPYKKLSKEYQIYEDYIEKILLTNKLIDSDKIDKDDSTYIAWATNESISLSDYIKYCISQNWIDTGVLNLKGAYSDSDEIYNNIIRFAEEKTALSPDFDKLVYKYLIKEDRIKATSICNILIDQKIVTLSDDELEKWRNGLITSYNFMTSRIEKLDITPAQLALEPCTGSMVITNVNNGDVLALVSYPAYDNNYLANGADAEYMKKINSDRSTPLINYATQQKTAPGSTFKMVSSIAGLSENIIDTKTMLYCTGSFTEITDTHNCWIYPGHHGALNVTGAIRHSCNCFFYNIGYQLSLDENNNYNSTIGTDKLNKYATMLGLGDKSGIEIEEAAPTISNMYSVPSAIGQGTNNFTTVGLARYVTAIANKGTVFNLTLLNKITDTNQNIIKTFESSVLNRVELDDSYWKAIHAGMKQVVEDKSYFKNLGVEVAGKTGTAQQSKTHPDHGLFVCFAPYNSPEIAIAVRIANGYSSEYVADTTIDILKYYFKTEAEDTIIDGNAAEIGVTSISGD